MKTLAVSLALLFVGSSAYAQFAADSPYCRSTPDAPGCPPPVRIQIVPPKASGLPGTSPLVRDLLRSWDEDIETRRARDLAARADAREERRLRLEESREGRLAREDREARGDRTWQEGQLAAECKSNPSAYGCQAPQGATSPAPLAPEVVAQLVAFATANPDWEQHAPQMTKYAAKLRPGETDAKEYLTLLYRLAKMDAK